MLEYIFIKVLNLSIPAAFAILLVLAARLFLKRAPKAYSMFLWYPVLLRLLCPFTLKSAFSLIPVKSNSIPEDIGFHAAPAIDSGLSSLDGAVNSVLPPATPQYSANPIQIWLAVGALIWVAVAAVLLLASLLSLLRLKLRLRGCRALGERVFESDSIDTAFIMGLARPCIYLPRAVDGKSREAILLHERAHIRRGDHIAKLLLFLGCCIHWFNPLVWVAFRAFIRDMEMSCDEMVLKTMDAADRKSYAETLLSIASAGRFRLASPIAFGESDIKVRIKNALTFKKPKVYITVLSVLLVAAVALFAMMSSEDPIEEPPISANPVAGESTSEAEPDPYAHYIGGEEVSVEQLLTIAAMTADGHMGCDCNAYHVYTPDCHHWWQNETTLYLIGHTICTNYQDPSDGVAVMEGGYSAPVWAEYEVESLGGEVTLKNAYRITCGTLYEEQVLNLCVDENGIPVESVAEKVLEYDDAALYELHLQQLKADIEQRFGVLTKLSDDGKKFEVIASGTEFLGELPGNIQLVLQWPIGSSESGVITRSFTEQHKGLDIGAPYGTDILAAAAGTVSEEGFESARGYYVTIDHGGYFTRYSHNSENAVSLGDEVAAGQKIAELGDSGNATGPHLDFRLIIDGEERDPEPYIYQ